MLTVFDGIPRTKQQIDMTSGGLLGEAAREGTFLFMHRFDFNLLKNYQVHLR
jgi:hypothetical protein